MSALFTLLYRGVRLIVENLTLRSGRPTDFERSAPGEMSRERLIECASKEAKWKRIRGIELDEEEEDGDGLKSKL